MKKVLKVFSYTLFLIITVPLLLEMCFRYQVIDFYSSEWKLLNTHSKKIGAKKTMLVFGDSYSASSFTYIDVLRDSFPDFSIYNAAIPGTGIRQTALIAKDRIREINPDIIVYQLYIGNDLSDIEHPINWSKLSFSRNCYWWLSDRLLFLHYLNYTSGQFAKHEASNPAKMDSIFSIEKYNPREKVFIESDPCLFENEIVLAGKQQLLFEQLVEKMNQVFGEYLSTKRIYFLIIPENAQVNETYYANMKSLGCQFRFPYVELKEHDVFGQGMKRAFGNQVLDPLSFLQHADSLSNFYFANDPHLTNIGQSQVGRYMVSELKKRLK